MIAKSKKAALEEKILITGANGQLGYELCKRLEDRATSKPREAMDVTDIWKLKEWLPVLRPDMIVHCAAYTDPIKAERESKECWATNALATHALAVIAKRIGCPFLFISTDHVFGAFNELYDTKTPFAEQYPVGPLNVYGNSKAAAEYAVLQANTPKPDEDAKDQTPYWILRTARLYERPWRAKNNLPQTLYSLCGRPTPISLPEDTLGSSTYVPHLADAIMLIIENRTTFPSGTYHVANEGHASLFELGREFCDGVPRAPFVKPTTHEEYYARQNVSGSVMPRYAALTSKKFDALSSKPMPHWREAVAEYKHEARRFGLF